ncbi:MAG: hypothetical protein Q8O37_15945 [Sulfuricellaceae bacterium]|nr:hypothetical protein [Sulfuricellaceae bacterium]
MRERVVQLVMLLVAIVILLAFWSAGGSFSWAFPELGGWFHIDSIHLIWFMIGLLVGALGVFLLSSRSGGLSSRCVQNGSSSASARPSSSGRTASGLRGGSSKEAQPASMEMDPGMPWVSLDETTTVTVEEINRIEEEVDLFLMLGRPEMAIQMLSARIELEKSTDKCDPIVWFKLLDIYYGQNMREHFYRLALEIRDHFNVELPTWQTRMELASPRHGLEHFPGILKKIRDNWNRPSIGDYLHRLMQDNRHGLRVGFQEEAFRDILFLAEICEELVKEEN